MTLRRKLLLSLAPLILGLVVISVVGGILISRLGRSAEGILQDNYRSVLAVQRMMDAIEALDGRAMATVFGRGSEAGMPAAVLRRRFESELRWQEGNITEAGELAATERLRAASARYLDLHAQLERDSATSETQRRYFDELLPASHSVREAAEAVLVLNQDAMVRKSEQARRIAQWSVGALAAISLAGLMIALYTSTAMTRLWLRPLSVLGQATRRIRDGDLAARAGVEGEDEIAQLAADFNAMAERLQLYRASTLGELLRAQRAAQATIDSLTDPVLVLGVEGELLHANRAADVALRVDVESGMGALDPAVRSIVERVAQHAALGKGPYVPRGLAEALRIATPEGDRNYLPRANPLYSDEGDVVGATLVLQDVTRQIRFEELRNDLVATVAHELRTPLTSLHMAIYLLAEQRVGELTDKQADLVYAAREDCERLETTVDDLLDLSRIQAGRLELRLQDIEIETLIHDALAAQSGWAAQRQVRLRSEVLPGLGEVRADRDRIQLVFANLLANAIRHSPAESAVTVRATVDGRIARFEVIDCGEGIPHGYHEAIFEKYFRLPDAASSGAGLGLFIVREIIRAHGGRIGVESQAGKGSAFWFELPRA
jgi:two-component system, NtrC family, sensor histidine kinase KinB